MKYIFIAVILVGVLLRFYQLDNQYLYGDEKTELIASLKLNHQSWQSGVNYENPHPPLAKWLMGIPTKNIERNFLTVTGDPPNYVFEYLLYEIVAANYLSSRIVSAVAGSLFIVFIFLLTKKLFGADSAFMSSLLAAVSADMIFFSRLAMAHIYMMLFSLLTLYFYINYLREGRKEGNIVNLALAIFFLFMTVGSRSIQPLFLVASVLISQFIFRRKREYIKENVAILFSVLVIFVSIFLILYRPYANVFDKFGIKSVSDIFGISFVKPILDIFFRNSYANFVAILSMIFLAAIMVYKKKKDFFYSIKNNNAIFILLAFFLISFFALGLSRAYQQVDSSRYSLIMYIPVFIFGGFSVQKVFKGKFLLIAVVAAIASLISVAGLLPNNLHNYSNFGVDGYGLLSGELPEEAKKSINFLSSVDSPPITTNDMNLLIFYKSSDTRYRDPISLFFNINIGDGMPSDPRCNIENMMLLNNFKPFIVYSLTNKSVDNFIYDPNVCGWFQALNISEAFRNGNIRIYKIN